MNDPSEHGHTAAEPIEPVTITPPLLPAASLSSANETSANESTPTVMTTDSLPPLPVSAHPPVNVQKSPTGLSGIGTSPGGAPDHVLATQIEKHAAHERELRNLPPGGRIVPGIEDDKLFAMMRRFDKQIIHTLSPPTKLPAGEPDLRPSTLPVVPFNSDLLKSNVERCYATSGVSALVFVREMQRLMSWAPEERMRTASFAVAYFAAACFSMVIPLLVALCMVLVVVPSSRYLLFPPIRPPPGVAPSATDPTHAKGDSTLLGTPTSDHGVHRSKAEQVEQQAWEFTQVVQRFGVRVIIGGKTKGQEGNGELGRKSGKNNGDSDSDEEDSDEDDEGVVGASNSLSKKPSEGLATNVEGEAKTEMTEKELRSMQKQKRKEQAKQAKMRRDALVGKIAKTLQDGLGDFADALERFSNALSPPHPYPNNYAREKIAGMILLPVFLIFSVVPAHIWAQVASISFGIGFFCQPILIRMGKAFIQRVPNWQEYIDLRNSILSRVPTNAQLVLHLLRQSELSYNPIPPPPLPPSAQHAKQELAKSGFDHDDGVGADAASAELEGAAGGDGSAATNKSEEDADTSGPGEATVGDKAKKKAKGTILGGLRLAARKAATFRADVAIEGGRQKVGTKIDRLLYQGRAKDEMTPDSYPAKLDGTSGHLVLAVPPQGPTTDATLYFLPLRSSTPRFVSHVSSLVELKKGGVWIGRAVLGWAASTTLESTGLEMRFKDANERENEVKAGGLGHGEDVHDEVHEGDLWKFSHVGRRDQLFARLISLGGQQWESL